MYQHNIASESSFAFLVFSEVCGITWYNDALAHFVCQFFFDTFLLKNQRCLVASKLCADGFLPAVSFD